MIQRVTLNDDCLQRLRAFGLRLEREQRVMMAWAFADETIHDPPPWVADRLKWSMDKPGAIRFVPSNERGPLAIMNVTHEGQEMFTVIGPGGRFLKWGENEVGFVSWDDFGRDYRVVE